MSSSIEVTLPGLTREAAVELDRRADLAGLPLAFVPPRPAGRFRASRPALVELQDLREDPSIASETLDHPEGWPQDDSVREWLERAVRFLGECAPEDRFMFRAGWGDSPPGSTIDTNLTTFLAKISAGELRSDQLYDVRIGRSDET